jgi:hypothetical protein
VTTVPLQKSDSKQPWANRYDKDSTFFIFTQAVVA